MLSKWDLFTPALLALEPFRRPGIRRMLAAVHDRFPLTPDTTVLDVGSGSGTTLVELARYGSRVTAVEPSAALAGLLARRFPTARVVRDSGAALTSIADLSHDLSLVVAVLHGLPRPVRAAVYAELSRVTRQAVLVFDYHPNRSPLVALAEGLEGSHYQEFMAVAETELREVFRAVETIPITAHDSLRICRVG